MTVRAPVSLLAIVTVIVGAACATTGSGGAVGPQSMLDTVTLWIHTATDSVPVVVEVADEEAEQSVGLSGREAVPAGTGMLFVFDEARTPDDGYWMMGTLVPLDIAFLGPDGVVLGIETMQPCEPVLPGAPCEGYFVDEPHWAGLEVTGGWLERMGVRAGARVELPRPRR